jgi:group I intron endonuclease
VFIYLITNSVTGKHYVGKWQGKNLNQRFRTHFSEARLGSTLYLHRSMRKHGFEKFSIHPLCSTIIDKQELCRWEREFIAMFKTMDRAYGYNLTPGGDGVGYKFTEEAKRKMSPSAKRRGALTQFFRDKHGAANPMFSKTHNPETRQRLSDVNKKNTGEKKAFFGKTHTAEAKAKISAARTGRKLSAEHLAALKAGRERHWREAGK